MNVEWQEIEERVNGLVTKAYASGIESSSRLFQEIKDELKGIPIMHENISLIQQDIRAIVEQNKIRNGRIDKCEEKIGNLKSWRSYSAGAIAILLLIGIPLVSIIYVLQTKRIEKLEECCSTIPAQPSK